MKPQWSVAEVAKIISSRLLITLPVDVKATFNLVGVPELIGHIKYRLRICKVDVDGVEMRFEYRVEDTKPFDPGFVLLPDQYTALWKIVWKSCEYYMDEFNEAKLFTSAKANPHYAAGLAIGAVNLT